TAGFAQVQFYPASGANVAQSFAVIPRGTGQPNNRAQFSIFNTDFIANNQAYEFLTMRARGSDFVVGTGKVGSGLIRPIIFSAGLMTDNVTNNNQLVLATDGSVGIGTAAPTQKLEVAGGVKLSGPNGAIFFPDGTSMTTASAGGGNYIQNTTTQQANSNFNVSGDGTAGGTLSGSVVNAATQFNLGGQRILSNQPGGNSNLFIGFNSPSDSTTYFRLGTTFVGSPGSNMRGHNLTVVGSNAGTKTWSGHPTQGNNITLIGAGANADPQSSFSYYGSATAIGANAFVSGDNSLVLGSISGVNGATSDTSVGIGTHAPQFKLHVVDPSNKGLRVQTVASGGSVASFGGQGEFQVDAPGVMGGRFVIKENGDVGIGWANPSNRLDVNGTIGISQLGAAGSTALCLNDSFQISSCSSSIRYKTNVAGFSGGLNLIDRLRPVTFDWTESKAHDIGLVAEEVAAVEPLLTLHNRKGEIEGVKYDRLNVVLINAIKEQQAQIESQADSLATLQKENLEMKRRLAALEQSLRRPRQPN
ncbi:MAG TPA: tail fiber domain-containing protein, partial [Pyrinomonadaceae bacterium]|nr:tail fiber domain-containing protein [Pyrinomonadaceae bacterium]